MPAFKTKISRRTFVASGVGGMVALATEIALAQDQAGRQRMQATIDVGASDTTLINLFSVEPDNQQKLVDVLKGGTDEFFSKAPGFISSSVLTGKDGRRVINYSQWKSA